MNVKFGFYDLMRTGRYKLAKSIVKSPSFTKKNANTTNGPKGIWTPITISIMHNRIDIVKLLVEKGGDPNIILGDDITTTALYIAKFNKKTEIVKYLTELQNKNSIIVEEDV